MADQARCAAIYLAARRVAFPWVPGASFAHGDFLRDTVDEDITVAETRFENGESRVAGFVSAFTRGRFIHHLYIDPDCRRRGIGRALCLHLIDLQPGPWRLKCVIANQPAMAFYRLQGWVEEGRGEDTLGPYVTLRRD